MVIISWYPGFDTLCMPLPTLQHECLSKLGLVMIAPLISNIMSFQERTISFPSDILSGAAGLV
jgi:hypothetical protein